MCAKARTKIDYRSVELDGVRYVIVREAIFDRLCERANVKAATAAAAGQTPMRRRTSMGSRWPKNSCGGDWLRGCRRRSWRGVQACGRKRSTASSAATPRPILPRSANSSSPWTRPSSNSQKSRFHNHQKGPQSCRPIWTDPTKRCPRAKQVLEEVRQLVAEQIALPVNEVREEHDLIVDLAYDSLDVVELAMELEEHFNITVPDTMSEQARSVGQIADGVMELIAAGSAIVPNVSGQVKLHAGKNDHVCARTIVTRSVSEATDCASFTLRVSISQARVQSSRPRPSPTAREPGGVSKDKFFPPLAASVKKVYNRGGTSYEAFSSVAFFSSLSPRHGLTLVAPASRLTVGSGLAPVAPLLLRLREEVCYGRSVCFRVRPDSLAA